ncbi:MAG TPA: RimK/LysX family protein [Candidatus Saccharimonadales bacterium]|nr:RimK/LysX family protein [Candidatus Saccharimonadales bacterium]
MKQLAYIGIIELVSFPDGLITGVPAKVDTGADGSAIWASNIHLSGGKLVFNFFAPGSAFYQTEPVRTTAFKITTVKNSFGHQEFRYKIRLNVVVGEHSIKRWFSLADRSNSTYPVLLGKNFLKNRFVVDVAQKFVLSSSKISNKVFVLSTNPTDEFFKLVRRRNQVNVRYSASGYDSLICYMGDNDARIINTKDKNNDVANYAFTYFKSHTKHAELASATAEYLRYKSRPFADQEIGRYISNSKLSQYMKLSCYDLPIPQSICAYSSLLKERYSEIISQLGTPFVLKEANSDKGKNNYLVKTKKDFEKILNQAPQGFFFLAQKYINNDGFMRVYVLDKEVQLAIWRRSYPGTDELKMHLNKPAGGKNASLIELDKLSSEVKDLAVRAAVCLDRQIAGVDLVQDKDSKKWYILEVNNAPQIRSGSFVKEKAEIMARFFDKELRE